MKKSYTYIAGVLIVFSLSFQAAAQRNVSQKWEIGLWAGGANYFGDIHPDILQAYKIFRQAGGLYARKILNPRLAVKLSGNYARIIGNDAWSKSAFEQARNLSFRSDIFEIASQFEFNFFPYILGDNKNNFSPYLFVGVSAFYHNPKAYLNGSWIALQPLGTEGQQFPDFYGRKPYKLFQVGIPFGGGFKYSVTSHLTLGLEFGYRFTFTDYLDDISTTYVDQQVLMSGANGTTAATLADRSVAAIGEPIGTEGKQRGDVKRRDAYMIHGISISYTFRSLLCPYPSKRY